MYRVLALLALASVALAGIQTQEFAAQLTAAHDESGHGDRLLLCSEMPGERSLQVTFFSVSNVATFKAGGKAKLQEMSPLEIKENRKKVNCSMNVDDMAINFGQERSWDIHPINLDQKVNIPNVPFQRIGHALCDEPNNGECLRSLITAGEEYMKEQVSVSDILLNGVDVSSYKNLIAQTPILKGELPELEKSTFAILPELHYPKKLTLNSEAASYAKIMLMDDQSELLWWKTPSSNAMCSAFPGTTGETFPGQISQSSVLHFYSEDSCATGTLVYDSTHTDFGFPALKFVFHSSQFASSTGCYCVGETCLPDGAIDLKTCQRGLPYVLSFPHFLNGAASLKTELEGMNPDASKHQSYFIIEPTTGMLIESSLKYQLNVDFKKFKHADTSLELTIADTLLPLYWFDRKYKLDDTHINAIKAMLLNPATTTTTTTTVKPIETPGEPAEDSQDLEDVKEKLNDIATKISVMMAVVFTFVVLAVVILAGFSLIQFHENKKARLSQQGLPAYVQYETKVPK